MTRIIPALVALGLLIPPAQAHLTYLAADDPINLWLGRQYSAEGSWCCNTADAHLYYGGYDINPDGSVTLPLDGGGTVVVPKERVLAYNPRDPNPTGAAVLWYHDIQHVYCLAIGPLT